MNRQKKFREVISAEYAVQIFKRKGLIFTHEQVLQILLFAIEIAKLVVEESEKEP